MRGSGETYTAIAALAARAGLGLTLTCVEMCDGQHPPEALCGPEGLLRQVREVAAAAGVPLGGENALPIYGPGHADGRALTRVRYNTGPWAPPLQEAGRARAELYGVPAEGGTGEGRRAAATPRRLPAPSPRCGPSPSCASRPPCWSRPSWTSGGRSCGGCAGRRGREGLVEQARSRARRAHASRRDARRVQ